MMLAICFAVLDVLALAMMVLTIRSCARNLDPRSHLIKEPTRIKGQVLDVIPEGTIHLLPDRVT